MNLADHIMSSRMIDVNELYFEHKILAFIAGEPTFDTLQRTLLQLKVNESSVSCTIDSGAHGFVVVTLSPATYINQTPLTPSLIPTHPRILTIPVEATT